jgi:hypothetical protein
VEAVVLLYPCDKVLIAYPEAVGSTASSQCRAAHGHEHGVMYTGISGSSDVEKFILAAVRKEIEKKRMKR